MNAAKLAFFLTKNAVNVAKIMEHLKMAKDETTKLVEYFNRLQSMAEWNDEMAKFYEVQKDSFKQISHSAASGALLAAAAILEEDYLKEN
jgi:hypothetical protein